MAGPRHVWVLVPAAGESRRFREAGFKTPKPRLKVSHGDLYGGAPRRMLHHVLSAVPDDSWPRLAALPAPDDPEDLRGIGGEALYPLQVKKTKGQADTLRQMIRSLPARDLDSTAILIVNCDVVFRDPADLAWIVQRVMTGFTVASIVVESQDPAMSYAYPFPCPQKFVEKQLVGRHAMAGAWAFANATRLLRALDWACCQGSTEPYLSHAMNRIHGPKISHLVEREKYLDWGTPANLKLSGARAYEA